MKFTPIPENNEELHLPQLVYCASLGEIEQVKALLEQGIDPNQTDDEGYSALQAAAENGYLELFNYLFSKAQMHIIKVNIQPYSSLKWPISNRLLSIS